MAADILRVEDNVSVYYCDIIFLLSEQVCWRLSHHPFSDFNFDYILVQPVETTKELKQVLVILTISSAINNFCNYNPYITINSGDGKRNYQQNRTG